MPASGTVIDVMRMQLVLSKIRGVYHAQYEFVCVRACTCVNMYVYVFSPD